MANHKTDHKSTQAELEVRIQEMVKLVLSGLDRSAIIRYIAEKTNWDITDRTVDKYLQSARERIAEHGALDRAYEIGKAISRLNNLYARNLQINDFKAALATQKEINALFGLYEPQRLDVTSDNKKLSSPIVYLPAPTPIDDSSD